MAREVAPAPGVVSKFCQTRRLTDTAIALRFGQSL